MHSGAIGLFGKIPAAGDFVSRGFSAKLTEALDQMLQAALQSAVSDGVSLRELMQVAAQPVMVSIRPGAICATGFWGLWVPSQDRVGRVFPLCIGLETLPTTPAGMPLVWPSESLIRSVLESALAATRDGWSADDLLRAIPPASDWQSLACQNAPFVDMQDSTIPTVPVDACNFWLEGPEARMHGAARALCTRLPWVSELIGCSFDANGQPQSFFAARSLLSWSSLAAVFDGRWSHWGWIVQPAANNLGHS